jgi:hypothetical protein
MELLLETSLYLPVKRFLEGRGFIVKGEVGGCDLVALGGDDSSLVVIGELKLAFNLELILQAVDSGSPRAFRREEVAERTIRGFAIFAAAWGSACWAFRPPAMSRSL